MPKYTSIIYICTPNVSDAEVKGMEHRPKYVDEVIVGPQFEVNQVSLRIHTVLTKKFAAQCLHDIV